MKGYVNHMESEKDVNKTRCGLNANAVKGYVFSYGDDAGRNCIRCSRLYDIDLKNVSQIFEKSMNRWIKYNNKTGRILERGIDDKPFKNVKIETTVIKARIGYTPTP